MTLRKIVKSLLFSIPGAEHAVKAIKRETRLLRKAVQGFLYDYRMARVHMRWDRAPGQYWPLSSELIFQFHKLEKGLCLPAESRRFFGAEAARETCHLLREWQRDRPDLEATVYRAAIETLRAWRERCNETPPPVGSFEVLFAEIDELLANASLTPVYQTPIPNRTAEAGTFEQLKALMISRRSMRSFDRQLVNFALIERALAIAQLSPSACNRQPWHLHFYDDPDAIRAMLSLQNGNAGFAHTIPLLAVVTADRNSFFDASERMEPALDGGLFLMSFLLALQSLGLSSCCLNWCVLPEIDRRKHALGQIPPNEQILTYLAIGHARPDTSVPLSARRPLSDVIRRHRAVRS